jgi:hypothetical protein
VLVSDLLFGSRITSMASNHGKAVQVLRSPEQLEKQKGATKLIVDLNQVGALMAAGAWVKAGAGREAIGFVSHVDAGTIAEAKGVGITHVIPRSRFFELLPALIA